MKKKTENEGNFRPLGVTRAAELYNRDESTITRWCKNHKIVARQQFPGAPWEIFMPEKEYHELKKILELKRKPMKPT